MTTPPSGSCSTVTRPATPGTRTWTSAISFCRPCPRPTFQWQSVDLAGLPLAETESTGGSLTYFVDIDVSSVPTNVEVTVTLPPSFSYVPGSSSLGENPIADPAGGTSLVWTLNDLSVGDHTLGFGANAGIGLGPAQATVSTSVGGTTTSTSSTSVDVIDGEEPAIDNPAIGAPLTPGVLDSAETTQGDLNIGYLTSPGDLNDWTVTVPQGAELSLALTNLPATYDLELFGPTPAQLQGTPGQDLGGVTDSLPSIAPAQHDRGRRPAPRTCRSLPRPGTCSRPSPTTPTARASTSRPLR